MEPKRKKYNWLGNLILDIGAHLKSRYSTRTDFVLRLPLSVEDAIRTGFGHPGAKTTDKGGIGLYYDWADAEVIQASGCGLARENELFLQVTLLFKNQGRSKLAQLLYDADGLLSDLLTQAMHGGALDWNALTYPVQVPEGEVAREVGVLGIEPVTWTMVENITNWTARQVLYKIEIKQKRVPDA